MNVLKLAVCRVPRIILPRQFNTGNVLRAYEKDDLSDMPIQMKNPFQKEKQQCVLCKLKIQPDYKNVKLLSQFVSPFTGRIFGRHITGLCKDKQTSVEKEIKKAQEAGFMPSYNKEAEFLEDPRLFNPERPLRPHNF